MFTLVFVEECKLQYQSVIFLNIRVFKAGNRGVMVKTMDYEIVVSEFELQAR